jgi:hypothetical protein
MGVKKKKQPLQPAQPQQQQQPCTAAVTNDSDHADTCEAILGVLQRGQVRACVRYFTHPRCVRDRSVLYVPMRTLVDINL